MNSLAKLIELNNSDEDSQTQNDYTTITINKEKMYTARKVMTPNETSVVPGEGCKDPFFEIPSRTKRDKLKSNDGRRKDVRLGMLASGALNPIL
ncbi:hypothetical protein SLEP1_g4414 [Rubroshorea leprosula]|uniref:Uncharacterized protein n=1 Tax=Rubroshorea leprosula TaxID=152421 RepID=A0AAV5HY53_9ROSI|nr:hypothetical protein SLEP1_g4414 [Rubroshorea leprosula]